MAIQDGLLDFKGKMGKVSFFRSKTGHRAMLSRGVDGKRIAEDPNYIRTRENGAEFGRAAKAGKAIRNAFKGLMKQCADGKATTRLVQALMKVVKSDFENDRGLRNVQSGEIEFINGFDFNVAAPIKSAFDVPYTATIDRATGELKVHLPEFSHDKLEPIPGSTHFRIVSAGAAFDFELEKYEVNFQSSAYTPLDLSVTQAASDLVNKVSQNNPYPMVLVLGVIYYQEVKGRMYPFFTREQNTLAIVAVSGL